MDKAKEKISFGVALKRAFFGFVQLLPTILAVVGLVAIFQVYITPSILSKFFGYSRMVDILNATILGAISSGNGAISYVIADGLKQQGVCDAALIAFILSWVSLSFTHLIAEASVFGVRFTAYRNILSFLSAIAISYLSVITVRLF